MLYAPFKLNVWIIKFAVVDGSSTPIVSRYFIVRVVFVGSPESLSMTWYLSEQVCQTMIFHRGGHVLCHIFCVLSEFIHIPF